MPRMTTGDNKHIKLIFLKNLSHWWTISMVRIKKFSKIIHQRYPYLCFLFYVLKYLLSYKTIPINLFYKQKWSSMSQQETNQKESHQCGLISEGIPRNSEAIMPRHVPIWHKDPSAPLYFVGATYSTCGSEKKWVKRTTSCLEISWTSSSCSN